MEELEKIHNDKKIGKRKRATVILKMETEVLPDIK